jgi:hypothetical protein
LPTRSAAWCQNRTLLPTTVVAQSSSSNLHAPARIP